jgi:hypothetical protein
MCSRKLHWCCSVGKQLFHLPMLSSFADFLHSVRTTSLPPLDSRGLNGCIQFSFKSLKLTCVVKEPCPPSWWGVFQRRQEGIVSSQGLGGVQISLWGVRKHWIPYTVFTHDCGRNMTLSWVILWWGWELWVLRTPSSLWSPTSTASGTVTCDCQHSDTDIWVPPLYRNN